MELEPGAHLGPYEIVELRGKGGMGEVYRARDTRLGRDVAVKVLAGGLSADSTFKKRFEQEAKAISQLQHPHVCSLFDVGSSEGVDYLVMEYLEGETLEARIRRGPLPVDRLLRIGAEISEAIAAAHRGGIVHRDLKPGNVIDTRTGVKVLDFGLAAGFETAASPAATHAPTLAATLTAEGTIAGTLHYMSPEQLEGKEPDPGSDIWALGCVLYEMATGEAAFPGESAASVIAAVMTHRPEAVSGLGERVPKRLDWLIDRCLERDRERRWQSARDLALELERLAETLAHDEDQPAGRRADGIGRSVPTIVRASIELPREATLTRNVGRHSNPVAISPDGDLLVVAAVRDGQSRLYRRELGEFEFEEIPETEGASSPVFSSDGRSIAFHAGGWLQKLAISGGKPIPVRELPHFWGTGLDWRCGKGFVLTPSCLGTGLLLLSEDGRDLRELTSVDVEHQEWHHAWPQFLPGTDHVLFTIWGWRTGGLSIVSLGSGERRLILRGGMGGRLLGEDHLIYRNAFGSDIEAIRFDLDKLETVGEPRSVIDGVHLIPRSGGSGSLAVSQTGTIAYDPVGTGERSLVWLDLEGATVDRLEEQGPYESPSISPDGRRVAFQLNTPLHHRQRGSTGSGGDIWVHDLARGTRDRLTHRGDNICATWSPDGRRITFSSNRAGPWNLYQKEVDRDEEPSRLVETPVSVLPWSWSPDGSVLAFQEVSQRGFKVGFVSDAGEILPITLSRGTEKAPVFSPGGQYLAYGSDASGTEEIFVQPYPPTGQRWMVSSGGGSHARWAPSGDELFYLRGDEVWSASIQTDPDFRADRPRRLFAAPFEADFIPHYDVAKDGSRLLIVEREPDRALRLIVNWDQELRRSET